MHKPAHTSLHLAPVPPLDGDPYDALLTPQVFSRPRARTCGHDDIVPTGEPQSATAIQTRLGLPTKPTSGLLIHITNVCANPAMDSHVASPHRARYRLSQRTDPTRQLHDRHPSSSRRLRRTRTPPPQARTGRTERKRSAHVARVKPPARGVIHPEPGIAR